MMREAVFGLLSGCCACLAHAGSIPAGKDVYILGEVHDNPGHHEFQAEAVDLIGPSALVFEMLSAQQVLAITPDIRLDQDALETALEWAASGWPDFALYFPIFATAPEAKIYGAAFTGDLRGIVSNNQAPNSDLTSFFALHVPLPENQQVQREALQAEAHCNALPDALLPGMVTAQRVRDASLAYRALAALQDTGGPVVVITGNGHARTDWGVPFLLTTFSAERGMDINVWSVGQSEADQISGTFDAIIDAPAVLRPDPCNAFK